MVSFELVTIKKVKYVEGICFLIVIWHFFTLSGSSWNVEGESIPELSPVSSAVHENGHPSDEHSPPEEDSIRNILTFVNRAKQDTNMSAIQILD